MSQKRYEDDPELCKIVQRCMSTRLSYVESKPILEANNYPLSSKQFQRIKKRINDLTKNKTKELTPAVLNQFRLSSLDDMDKMKNDMFTVDGPENVHAKRTRYEFILKLNTIYQNTLMSLALGKDID